MEKYSGNMYQAGLACDLDQARLARPKRHCDPPFGESRSSRRMPEAGHFFGSVFLCYY